MISFNVCRQDDVSQNNQQGHTKPRVILSIDKLGFRNLSDIQRKWYYGGRLILHTFTKAVKYTQKSF